MRVFYYIFYVQLIRHELSLIVDMTKETMDIACDETKQTPKIDRIVCNRIKLIRNKFDLVYEMSDHINEVFGWSHFANVLYCFLLLVTDLNWFYWCIYFPCNAHIAGESNDLLSLFFS